MSIDHAYWAAYLQQAVEGRSEVQAITKQISALPIEDAYKIQDLLVANLGGDRGTLAGAKLGLTSKAKQRQMNVDEPAYGWIPSWSVLPPSGEVRIDDLIHPRVEPEFVFVLDADVSGPKVTADDVLDATERVVGGIEVIDSRYEKFSFTLPDVIADQTSAARVAIGGGGIAPRDANLSDIECVFTVDGQETGRATGEALLGSPAECVAMLARFLDRTDRGLKAGWVVLAGATTDARPFARGSVATASYSHFDDVTVCGI